jgi:hypothetical protein
MTNDSRYVCMARLDGAERWFFWDRGDETPDRVVVDGAGSIVCFRSERDARTSSSDVSPERAAIYDLDTIEAWCRSNSGAVDCPVLLNAWNLFGDLPRGHLFDAADARATGVYDKLFFGCNLPAVTPPGEHYVPTWTPAELHELKRVLLLGLADVRARLR